MLLARAWTFVSGAWLGLLVTVALLGEPDAAAAAAGAAAGAAALVAVAWIAVRSAALARPAPARAAAAAAWSWLALPAVEAARLDLPPGPGWLAAITAAAVALALWRARRTDAPPPGPGAWAGRAALAVVAGLVGWTALGVGLAQRGAGVAEVPETRARLVMDLDARVPTQPLPECGTRPAQVRELLDRGAHPRLTAGGRYLWLDARAPDGRRQVHRLEISSGSLECWTCEEPGNNTRPAPSPAGVLVIFETDRHARFWAPADRELYAMRVAADSPRAPATRLTRSRAADGHPVFGPDAPYVMWARAGEGRHQVLAASVRAGHGGVVLGAPGLVYDAGARWAAPLAWSPDARHLIVAEGSPAAPATAMDLDPATGAVRPLAEDAGRGAAFVADGGWLALATAAGPGAAGALPAWLSPVLAHRVARRALHAPLFRASGVRYGPADGTPPRALDLGDVAHWGESTGLALSPDGHRIYLAQRRSRGGRVEERILELRLPCLAPGEVAPGPAASHLDP